EALNYHKQFVAQYSQDSQLKLELAKSLYSIIQLEGEMQITRDNNEACDEPISILRGLINSEAENTEHHVWLARCLGLKSRMLKRTNSKQSMDLLHEAVTVLELTLIACHNDPSAQDQLSRLYQELGLPFEAIGEAKQETERPLEYYSRALEL